MTGLNDEFATMQERVQYLEELIAKFTQKWWEKLWIFVVLCVVGMSLYIGVHHLWHGFLFFSNQNHHIYTLLILFGDTFFYKSND